jgi:hypothetical protein
MAPTESKAAERRGTSRKMTATKTRFASFPALAALSAFVTVLLWAPTFAEAGRCEGKLVGNSYDCNYAFISLGVRVTYTGNCVKFTTGGLSENFDLVGAVANIPSDYGCACENIGTFKSPDEAMNSFQCVGNPNVVQIHGKAEPDKLIGRGSNESGAAIYFLCRKRSTACP